MKMDIDLEHLTEAERDAILGVLNRDEKVREKEQCRVRVLRTEVKQIRLKGVIKAGSDPNKTCARCRQAFGWLFNKGMPCPQCQHRVCEKCQFNLEEKGKWLCILCFKQAELEAMSGQWFYSKFRKSKRNKRTNQVVSGPELVKASIRRSHSSGGESRSSSVTDDIKRALSNNNASPKSHRSSASMEGESSDTQSMEAGSPARRRGRIEDVSFPRDSDRRKLKDLMRTKEAPNASPIIAPSVMVRKVSSARYDSDSSSDSSGPSSPQFSNRTESGVPYSDSVRSSTHSADAVSLQSSEGHMTVVTETNISDIETISHVSPDSSPYLGASRFTPDLPRRQVQKSSHSVIHPNSHSSQIDDSSSTGFDAVDSAASLHARASSSQDHSRSSSSESEEEYTTEQITKIKFRRVSMQKKSLGTKSPSPPTDVKPRSRTGSSNDAQPSTEASSELAANPEQSVSTPTPSPSTSPTLAPRPAGDGQTGGDTNPSLLHVEPCTSLTHMQPHYGVSESSTHQDSANKGSTSPELSLRESVEASCSSLNHQEPLYGVSESIVHHNNENKRPSTPELPHRESVEAGHLELEVPSVPHEERSSSCIKTDTEEQTLLLSDSNGQPSGDVRSKVGSLLAKYRRKAPAVDPVPVEKHSEYEESEESFNNSALVSSSSTSSHGAGTTEHSTPSADSTHSDGVVRMFGEFLAGTVVRDAMDTIELDSGTQKRPLIWSDSFSDNEGPLSDMDDDLEWDGDMISARKEEKEGLLQEIKAALASSLPGMDFDNEHSSPTHSADQLSPSYRRADDTRENFLDDDEELGSGTYQYRSYIGPQSSDARRFRRMIGQDETMSDTLSVITEHTEPEGSESELDDISDLDEDSDSEGGMLGERNSSVINLLDSGTDEDEGTTADDKSESMLAEMTVIIQDSPNILLEEESNLKVRRIPRLSRSEENSPSISLDTETDPALSNSQTLSELSDTESAQDMNALDSPTKKVFERRDTITILAEEASFDEMPDFTTVYEHNRHYAEESETSLDDLDGQDIVITANVFESSHIEKLETLALADSEPTADPQSVSKHDLVSTDDQSRESGALLSVSDMVRAKNVELESPCRAPPKDESFVVVQRTDELKQVKTRKLERKASKEHQGLLNVSVEEPSVDESHTSSVTSLKSKFDHGPLFMGTPSPVSLVEQEETDSASKVMRVHRRLDPKDEALLEEIKRMQNKSPAKLSMSAEDLPPNTPVSEAIAETLARSLDLEDDEEYDLEDKLPGKRFADGESESESKQKMPRWNPCPTPEPSDMPQVALVAVGSKRKHNLLPSSSSSSDSEEKAEDSKNVTADNSWEVTFSIFQQQDSGAISKETEARGRDRDYDLDSSDCNLGMAHKGPDHADNDHISLGDLNRESSTDDVLHTSGQYGQSEHDHVEVELKTDVQGMGRSLSPDHDLEEDHVVHTTDENDTESTEHGDIGSPKGIHCLGENETLGEDGRMSMVSYTSNEDQGLDGVMSTDTGDNISQSSHSVCESDASVRSEASESQYLSSDFGASPYPDKHGKRVSQLSIMSFSSTDALVDDASDTAEERANPDKLEEDFTLSLDLGPRMEHRELVFNKRKPPSYFTGKAEGDGPIATNPAIHASDDKAELTVNPAQPPTQSLPPTEDNRTDSKSTEHTATASTVTVVSSNAPSESGSTSAPQHGEEAKKFEDASTASVTSVPSIAVTHPDQTSLRAPSEQDSLGELYEDENIDELFASHSGSSTLGRQKGLLSPFGDSRESIVSYYSDAGEGNYGNIPITGDILFGLEYNYKTGSLEVGVKQCRDLAPVDTKKKRSDPYVKTYLLPDRTKSGKRKTRIKKNSLNPVFDEVLKYTITKSELETRTLWLTVWNNDIFGRNDFLGEVTIPLDYYSFDESTPHWYKLQERIPMSASSRDVSRISGSRDDLSMDRQPAPPEGVDGSSAMSMLAYKGDLIVSLRYVSAENVGKRKGRKSKGELHVLVKEARNLTAVRSNGSSDPFCKGYLLPDKGRATKQKTPVVKKDCNPQWNHTFMFEDVSLSELRDRSLELTVWDHDRFTSNDFLGGLRLNSGSGKVGGKEVDFMDARGEEVSVWQAILDRPNTWVDAGLMLRPNMSQRT